LCGEGVEVDIKEFSRKLFTEQLVMMTGAFPAAVADRSNPKMKREKINLRRRGVLLPEN
jgi:hypothetical protein